MSKSFSKNPKTLDKQLEILISRGMIVGDRHQAKFYLQHLNYYRLRAYWLVFEDNSSTTHQFIAGTEFQNVLDLYIFDRELRLLILDAIERIEVSVRSQWAYQLAHLYGSHAHLNQDLFNHFWQKNLDSLTREVERSDEIFIKHFQHAYAEPLPPIWAVCEVMSLGLLSRWYKSLRFNKSKTAIAKIYGVRAEMLESWLQHLTVVRNTCAHHSRLWNREFSVTPQLPNSPRNPLTNQFKVESRKIYNTLVIILYLLDLVSPDHHWRSRLRNLLVAHSQQLSSMDFLDDWLSKTIWVV